MQYCHLHIAVCGYAYNDLITATWGVLYRERGREGGRERGREGGKEGGGREGGRKGGREGGRGGNVKDGEG